MAQVTKEFYDDSSSTLGVSHAWKTDENPLLSDTAWNDRQNIQERERLEKSGEALPPRVLKDGTLEDRDLEEQIKVELDKIEEERPDLNFPAQLELAKDRVSAKQKQTHRNQGAYEEESKELARITSEQPSLPLVDRQRLARERVSVRESQIKPLDKPKDRAEEGLGASTQSLMAHPHGGGKKGSRSGRKARSRRRGTWVCPNCKLEYCIHRPKRSRGPKPKEGILRHKQKTVYISELTIAQLNNDELTLSDFLSCASIARRENRSLDEVIHEWKKD